jgi:hypothetical protein
MRHVVKVVPARIRYLDPELLCRRRRVIGYRAACECGEYSGVKATVRLAREWRAEHLAADDEHEERHTREHAEDEPERRIPGG